jgi:ferredoxin
MIIARRKPFRDILEMLRGYERILIAGCGTCVAVCLAGGEKEVGLLSSQLAIARRLKGETIELGEATVERQCDREFLKELSDRIQGYDAVLSMACGVGIQFLSDAYPKKVVLPAVDTSFIGANDDVGYWTERCRMCNHCYLGVTGAVCPVTMCPKGLLNGPCSGMREGMCEVDGSRPCAWRLIYDRLSETNRLDQIKDSLPPRRHSLTTTPATVIHDAYRRRYAAHG